MYLKALSYENKFIKRKGVNDNMPVRLNKIQFQILKALEEFSKAKYMATIREIENLVNEKRSRSKMHTVSYPAIHNNLYSLLDVPDMSKNEHFSFVQSVGRFSGRKYWIITQSGLDYLKS